jgi:hypothetical protein
MMFFCSAVLYLVIGQTFAYVLCPLSFPFGKNALVVTLLWPWPVAAQWVKIITGKYPSWTPDL